MAKSEYVLEIDKNEAVKKYAAEDARALSEKVSKEMNLQHFEALKEQAKAYSRDEQLVVASAFKADVLFEALGMEFARLNDFEKRIRATILQED